MSQRDTQKGPFWEHTLIGTERRRPAPLHWSDKLVLTMLVMGGCALGFAYGCAVRAASPAIAAQTNCWPIPNGMAFTIVCANGFWSSVMPDGTIEQGNGMYDPSASNPGSSIPLGQQKGVIDQGAVTPPPPNQRNPAPGQWYYYGGEAPQ